ncbi:KilA-N domain-containing protein [Marinobacterium rhizophilum]|uniref:KilA-N domain-containing protein n=1 Tax=Marinobacterium rhizophilum TaxID=420402 RepID=UPI00036BF9D5|nr:KilA-N domain-containing protein [Marinobacterium rhizophilum]
MSNLMIAGASIRQGKDGRYCRNDLHRAAGGEERHGPNKFLRSCHADALIKELDNGQIWPVSSKRGRSGGTYVARDLVYSYAMWISPAFNLQVIRAYHDMQTPKQLSNLEMLAAQANEMVRIEQQQKAQLAVINETKAAVYEIKHVLENNGAPAGHLPLEFNTLGLSVEGYVHAGSKSLSEHGIEELLTSSPDLGRAAEAGHPK